MRVLWPVLSGFVPSEAHTNCPAFIQDLYWHSPCLKMACSLTADASLRAHLNLWTSFLFSYLQISISFSCSGSALWIKPKVPPGFLRHATLAYAKRFLLMWLQALPQFWVGVHQPCQNHSKVYRELAQEAPHGAAHPRQSVMVTEWHWRKDRWMEDGLGLWMRVLCGHRCCAATPHSEVL